MKTIKFYEAGAKKNIGRCDHTNSSRQRRQVKVDQTLL